MASATHLNLPFDLLGDREQRLLNQRAFPKYFVRCACSSGCATCAHTGLVSKAEAKQAEVRNEQGESELG